MRNLTCFQGFLRFIPSWLVLTSLVSTNTAFGQVIVPSKQGKTEIIGLHRWTYQMLEDSLARYAPGESIRSHACEAVLESRLGFPSVSVNHVMDGEHTTVVITLVEPEDSAGVRYRTIVHKNRPVPSNITSLKTVIRHSLHAPILDYDTFLQVAPIGNRYGKDSLQTILTLFSPSIAKAAPTILRAQHRYRTEHDFRLATTTLNSDTTTMNRVVALGIVSNFPTKPEAWYTLMRALRDRNQIVRGISESILQSWISLSPPHIDWRPAQDDLTWLLGGTYVEAYTTVLTVLDTTAIPPVLARELLGKSNLHLLLSHVAAESEQASTPAQGFLRIASGKDFGRQVDAWQTWYQSTFTRGPNGKR